MLSNNDGCVVARSQEVKALGVKMGTPIHHIRALVAKHQIAWFSSNYALYGEISRRMMAVMGQFSPRRETYSIDECFLDLSGMHRAPADIAQELRRRVRSWVGIPTCVGIGESKTLAKLANAIAKKTPSMEGVCDLTALSATARQALLEGRAVADVWGIGRKLGARLESLGVQTADDLRQFDLERARSQFGIVVVRTIEELRGISCADLEERIPAKKQICSSRSFGKYTNDIEEICQAVTEYTARAAEKLRRQNGICAQLQVGLLTNPFKDVPQHHPVGHIRLSVPTADTLRLVSIAVRVTREIWRPGYIYKKAEVMFTDINPATYEQLRLFDEEERRVPAPPSEKRARLMATLDAVNTKWERGTLRVASAGDAQPWQMRRERMTPAYTSSWNELPVART